MASGAYRSTYKKSDDITKVTQAVQGFKEKNGRPPRILVAKVGQGKWTERSPLHSNGESP